MGCTATWSPAASTRPITCAYGLPIGNAEGVNSAAQHADGLLRHDGEAETLGDIADLLWRRAGGNWNTTSSGENRVSPIGGMPEPGGSGMTDMSMRRVPGGAPLPPFLPLARLPGPTAGPAAAPVAAGGGRGLAQTDLEGEAGAIGLESLRVVAEAGIDRIVNRAHNGLPRYLRDQSA